MDKTTSTLSGFNHILEETWGIRGGITNVTESKDFYFNIHLEMYFISRNCLVELKKHLFYKRVKYIY